MVSNTEEMATLNSVLPKEFFYCEKLRDLYHHILHEEDATKAKEGLLCRSLQTLTTLMALCDSVKEKKSSYGDKIKSICIQVMQKR